MYHYEVKKHSKWGVLPEKTSKNATKTANSGLISVFCVSGGNGAQYLDPKTSRWLSGDPAMGEYIPLAPINDEAKKRNGNLPGMGACSIM